MTCDMILKSMYISKDAIALGMFCYVEECSIKLVDLNWRGP